MFEPDPSLNAPAAIFARGKKWGRISGLRSAARIARKEWCCIQCGRITSARGIAREIEMLARKEEHRG